MFFNKLASSCYREALAWVCVESATHDVKKVHILHILSKHNIYSLTVPPYHLIRKRNERIAI
jgi:hypothetical protein